MLRIFLGKDVTSDEILRHALEACSINTYKCMKNAYGKPYLEGNPVFFSISHAGPYTICAVSDREVGIDLEENTYRPRIADKIFTKEESTYVGSSAEKFTEVWTLKEAYCKFTGNGVSDLRKSRVVR